MIKNERQYRITRGQAEKFEQALNHLADQRQPVTGPQEAQQHRLQNLLHQLQIGRNTRTWLQSKVEHPPLLYSFTRRIVEAVAHV